MDYCTPKGLEVTAYNDAHDPRTHCPHNVDPNAVCTCRRRRQRKPYRTLRVADKNVSRGIRPQLILEVHPDGRLVLREQGRRTRVETTLGTVYEQCLAREARRAVAAKRKA
jgi:hypothetical protein